MLRSFGATQDKEGTGAQGHKSRRAEEHIHASLLWSYAGQGGHREKRKSKITNQRAKLQIKNQNCGNAAR